MEENKKEKCLRNIYRIINWILAIFILVFSTYTLRYSGEYELYINEDNKDRIYTYIGEENLKTDSEVKKIVYEEVWDNNNYEVYYEDGEKEVLYLEGIPWQDNLIKEEGIYIPVRNLGITFILVIIFILNTIKIRKDFKKDKQNMNISIMVKIILTFMIICNIVFTLTTPFLMIPVLILLVFGGTGLVGLISYYIEKEKTIQKSSSDFLKILFVNYIVLLAVYSIYMISWGAIMEFNVIISIVLVAGEGILGYAIGRFMDMPNIKRNHQILTKTY